jgi:hypothetical protein
MCEMCQFQFAMDHETKARGNVPCPKCANFYVPPGQESCYHCFAEENLNEKCRRCRRKGAKRRTTRVN